MLLLKIYYLDVNKQTAVWDKQAQESVQNDDIGFLVAGFINQLVTLTVLQMRHFDSE